MTRTLEKWLIRKFEGRKVLFVADLHVGYDAEYRRRGLYLPFDSSRALLNSLFAVINQENVHYLVLLGDFIHSFPHFNDDKSTSRGASFIRTPHYSRWLITELREFFDLLHANGVQSHLLVGNHDVLFRKHEFSGLMMHDSRGSLLAFGETRVGCAHGHVPPINLAVAEEVLLGHLHPAVVLVDDNLVKHRLPVILQGKLSLDDWLEMLRVSSHGVIPSIESDVHETPIYDKMITITVLPSANPYMTGTPLNMVAKKRKNFEKGKFYQNLLSIVDFDVFLVNKTYLGKLSDLLALYVEKMGARAL